MKIDSVCKFLNSIFRAYGDQKTDIKAGIAAAFSKMRDIWAARSTSLRLKMRIYTTEVFPKLSYGSEAWILDERAIAMLNGAMERTVFP